MSKIVFFNNNLSGIILFRKEVIEFFLNKGYSVSIIAPEESDASLSKSIPNGAKYIPIKMDRTTTNPFKDLVLLLKVLIILFNEKPKYLFNYTIKPNIYGAIAAKLLGVSATNMIAGLGYSFTNNNFSSRIARLLYSLGCSCADNVLLLNRSNYEEVVRLNLCKESKLILLPGGEGVDLLRYQYYSNDDSVVRFVFIGRLIREKGYEEFVSAAKYLSQKYHTLEFQIVGGLDESYPNPISRKQLNTDIDNSNIIYRGLLNDMSAIYKQRGVVICIPSYYSEGLNRSLMEGCASGKPIITTDWPGCRETVDHGINGYLVKPKCPNSLIDAMEAYINLSKEKKEEMSRASRKKAEKDFSIDHVITEYWKIVCPN